MSKKKNKKQKHNVQEKGKNVANGILQLAAPMILCHVFQTMFNVVDMVWIGKLGVKEVASISWAGNVLLAIVTLIIGISTGTTAIINRNIGAKEYEEASRTAFHSLLLGFFSAGILAIFGYFYIEKIIVLLGAGAEIAQVGASYLRIIFMGSIPMFFMFLLSAILQGSGDMKTPIIAVLTANVFNLVLDPLLIFGIGFFPRLEVDGAAIATVISRSIGMLICMTSLFKEGNRIRIFPHYMKINPKIFSRILKIGIPGLMALHKAF